MNWWPFSRRRLDDEQRRTIRAYLASAGEQWESRCAFVRQTHRDYADIDTFLGALRFELGVMDRETRP